SLTTRLFPQDHYRNPARREIKLVAWLLAQREDNILTLPSDPALSGSQETTAKLVLFTSLLAPGSIDAKLIAILGSIWNQRALPGFAMISPLYAGKVLGCQVGDNLIRAVTKAVGGRRFKIPYQNFVFPVCAENQIFPVVLSIT